LTLLPPPPKKWHAPQLARWGGAVTAVQRTSSDLRLNPQLHLVALDGAWHERGGELSWQGLGHLQTSEVGAVLESSVRRIERHLRRRGLLGIGDLEQALLDAGREVDVHMAAGGANLQCVDCHVAPNHRMLGKLYSVSSMNRDRSSCEQCHGATPHGGGILDEHTLKVACQTCHIPTYAKAAATKLTWDWSTAGRLRDGRPYEEKDAEGNVTYASTKGTFTWGRDIRPEYAWFNGTAGHYLLGDAVPGTGVVQVNTLHGSYADPDAKIVPVKIHRGRQIYDPGTGMLVQPKLYAPAAGQGAFWKDFDWDSASREGMKAAGLPYSGRHAFVETTMYWPVNHMVTPRTRRGRRPSAS
jgi:hypothetical protein